MAQPRTSRSPFMLTPWPLPRAGAVTVHLGAIRTHEGRLLVLGGFGTSALPTNSLITGFLDNASWYDDISDGTVTAHVKINSTSDEFDAVGAWVIVGPPTFAAQIDNVMTLYDRIFHMGVAQVWVSGPSNPSHTHDIHPIPEGARTDAPSHLRGKVLRRQATIVSEEQGDQERASRLLDAAEAEAIAVSDRPPLKL